MVEQGIDGEDVVSALVIGHEHIACGRIDVFSTLYLHFYERHGQKKPGPYHLRIIAAPAAEAENGSSHDCQSSEYGGHQQHRGHDEKLIYAVENYHSKGKVRYRRISMQVFLFK